MKIGPIETKPPGPSPVEHKTSRGPLPKTPTVPSTEVALSPAATEISHTASDPTFDTAKVHRIATAIREGKFSVNAEAIADKLIINAEELLGRKAS